MFERLRGLVGFGLIFAMLLASYLVYVEGYKPGGPHPPFRYLRGQWVALESEFERTLTPSDERQASAQTNTSEPSAPTRALAPTAPAPFDGPSGLEHGLTCPPERAALMVGCELDHQADRARLIQGAPGLELENFVPSTIVPFDPLVTPVIFDASGRSVVVASRVGKGRVWMAGHPSALSLAPTQPANAALAANALTWIKPGTPSLRIGLVGPGWDKLTPWLQAKKHQPRPVTLDALKDLDVVLLRVSEEDLSRHRDALEAFVRGGGGLLVAGIAWTWLEQDTTRPARSFPGNRLLSFAGAYFAAERGRAGLTPVTKLELLRTHPAYAVDALLDTGKETKLKTPIERTAARAAIRRVADLIGPEARGFWARLDMVLAAHKVTWPTASKPRPWEEDPALYLHAIRDAHRQRWAPPISQPHATSGEFPGLPKKAPRGAAIALTRSLDHNADTGGLVTTDLWAPAGAEILVTVPDAVAGQGVQVVVNARRAPLWSQTTWGRFPDVSLETPIYTPITRVVSMFGGPISLRVPKGATLGNVGLSIEGARPMPTFTLGETTPEAWSKARASSIPWARLRAGTLELEVPTADVRALKKPGPVLERWVKVLERVDAWAPATPKAVTILATRHADAPAHLLPFVRRGAKAGRGLVDPKRADVVGGAPEALLRRRLARWLGASRSLHHGVALYAALTIHRDLLGARGLPNALSKASARKRAKAFEKAGKVFSPDNDALYVVDALRALEETGGKAWLAPALQELGRLHQASPAGDAAGQLGLWVQAVSTVTKKNYAPFFAARGWPVPDAVLQVIGTLPAWDIPPQPSTP